MLKHLILRLDAPLMSFGAPIIDNFGRTERFMSLSAITGLLSNALGFDHSQVEEIERLQSRLRLAQRCDRTGRELRDFQTVALGQDFLKSENAWTTWGVLDERKGGPEAREGTHIRFRDYVADAIYTVAFCLDPMDESPTLDDCARALERPARPLFIGRKTCLPAAPLLRDHEEAESPLDALIAVPRIEDNRVRPGEEDGLAVWWSPDDGGTHSGPWREILVTDQRDWRNQIHGGQRVVRHGLIFPQKKKLGRHEARHE